MGQGEDPSDNFQNLKVDGLTIIIYPPFLVRREALCLTECYNKNDLFYIILSFVFLTLGFHLCN